MVNYIKSNKNYYYKIYKNGSKKRISKKEYLKNQKGGNLNNVNNHNESILDYIDCVKWINIQNILRLS